MADLLTRVEAGGMLPPGRPVLVLLSGGRDSVCLLDVAVRLAGREHVAALHCHYGLRDEADGDEAHCAALCDALGVELHVRRPRRGGGDDRMRSADDLVRSADDRVRGGDCVGGDDRVPRGNLQAWARDARYSAAFDLVDSRGGVAAAGHTASDQVETVLYRLAASPGRRALLGMAAATGRLVRPLLGVTRAETAAHCAARGLAWREDAGNESPAFARNRLRHALLPALRALHPAAEANVLRTLDLLRDEADVLDAAVEDALDDAGHPPAAEALRALPPALRRLALQRLADAAAGGRAPAVGHRTDEVVQLKEGQALDVGGGLRAEVRAGALVFTASLGSAAPRRDAEAS